MTEPSTDGGILAGIGTVLGVAVVWAARKLMGNDTSAREAKAKRDIISTLEHDRDDARRERDEALEREANERAAALRERELRMNETMRVNELESEAQRLQSLLRKVARELPEHSKVRAMIASQEVTDFAPLGGPEKK